jgi:hypothetical protein
MQFLLLVLPQGLLVKQCYFIHAQEDPLNVQFQPEACQSHLDSIEFSLHSASHRISLNLEFHLQNPRSDVKLDITNTASLLLMLLT